MRYKRLLPWFGCALLTAAAGCQPSQGPAASAEVAPPIAVSQPVQREVLNYEDFTGQTDAVQVVDVRARVTGYLDETLFREGSEVHKGDLLFVIDPRPYQAQLDQAQAQVVSNEAAYKYANLVYKSDQAAPSAVSREQMSQDFAAVEKAEAQTKAAVASTEVYKLNMEFTQVKAPITGQVSRYYITPGNLVNQDQTLLTTVVSLDPMYAYFDMDEPTLLNIRRAIQEGRIKLPERRRHAGPHGPARRGRLSPRGRHRLLQQPGQLRHRQHLRARRLPQPPAAGRRSAGDCGRRRNVRPAKPHRVGVIRGRVGAPVGRPALDARLLSPGMFVRIRLPIGHRTRPCWSSIGPSSRTRGRSTSTSSMPRTRSNIASVITTGALQADGLRVIRDGLKADDWVVVGALQQVRPNMQIQPEPTPMPSFGQLGRRRQDVPQTQEG